MARRYKSKRTLLKAFLEGRISHDEYLRQARGLAEPKGKR